MLCFMGSPAWAEMTMGFGSEAHTCTVMSDGSVRCWGRNDDGQLGNDSTMSSTTPVAVMGITTATGVSTGGHHTCAVLSGGSVQCWGGNAVGQLGNGNNTASKTPVTVGGISNAVQVSAGEGHNCAVLANGSVQCWGYNDTGALGNGGVAASNRLSTTPVPVNGISTATAVSAGDRHSCAVLSTGSIQCWGDNFDGQLGNGKQNNLVRGSTSPITVIGINNATAVAAGGHHTCALIGGGSVQCWGSNFTGALGDGHALWTGSSYDPIPVTGISNATAVTTGVRHSCALLGNGAIQCWGTNDDGELANSDRYSTSPVTIAGTNNATSVIAGKNINCAVISNGEMQCWGNNEAGQLGNGRSNAWNAELPGRVLGTNGQGVLNVGTLTPTVSTNADADKVFTWAEKTFPQYFGPAAAASTSASGYRLRFYSDTSSYLGVNESGAPHLYYLGPLSSHTVMDLGLLTTWVVTAGH